MGFIVKSFRNKLQYEILIENNFIKEAANCNISDENVYIRTDCKTKSEKKACEIH